MRHRVLLSLPLVILDITYGFEHKLHLKQNALWYLKGKAEQETVLRVNCFGGKSAVNTHSLAINVLLSIFRRGLQLIDPILNTDNKIFHGRGIITSYLHSTAWCLHHWVRFSRAHIFYRKIQQWYSIACANCEKKKSWRERYLLSKKIKYSIFTVKK